MNGRDSDDEIDGHAVWAGVAVSARFVRAMVYVAAPISRQAAAPEGFERWNAC